MCILAAELGARPALLLLPVASLALIAAGLAGGWGRWRSDPDRVGWLVPGETAALEAAASVTFGYASAVIATALGVAFASGVATPGGGLRQAMRATRPRARVIAGVAAVYVSVSLAGVVLDRAPGAAGSVLGELLEVLLFVTAFYVTPVVALEKHGVTATFRRSLSLVRRSLGTLIGTGLLLWGGLGIVLLCVALVLVAGFDLVELRGGGLSDREWGALAIASPLAFAALVTAELWTLALYRVATLPAYAPPSRFASRPRLASRSRQGRRGRGHSGRTSRK